jgi:hypothetical protein
MIQNLGMCVARAAKLSNCQYQRVKPFISTVNESEPSIDSAVPLQLPGTL